MKKWIITSLAVLLMVSTNYFVTSAEENTGCFVTINGIMCEEDIPEGCIFNIEKRVVECPADLDNGNHCQKCVYK